MIRINVLEKLDPVHAAIIEFKQAQRAKSYTERHPELGRMINCPKCGDRHYSSKVCELRYATHRSENKGGTPYHIDESPLYAPIADQFGSLNRKAILGAAQFKGKRYNPHKRLDKTNALIDRRHRRTVEAKRRQDVSRRINTSLAKPGSRP